jgi:chromosome partitioning protein
MAGSKGGAMKSTLLQNLSVIHTLKGHETLLVDSDVQASTNSFIQLRDELSIEPRIPCIQKYGRSLQKEIQGLAQKYDTIFVDTPGRDAIETRGGMLAADILICPCQPSQLDLWAMEGLHDTINTVMDFNPNLRVHVVLSRVSPNRMMRDTAEARGYLQEFEHFTVCENEITERVVFRRAVSSGKSVVEMIPNDSKANNEIQLLYKEIFG